VGRDLLLCVSGPDERHDSLIPFTGRQAAVPLRTRNAPVTVVHPALVLAAEPLQLV
jgi:hypothetical protein